MQNKCKINLKKQEIIIKYHAASFDKLHAQQEIPYQNNYATFSLNTSNIV